MYPHVLPTPAAGLESAESPVRPSAIAHCRGGGNPARRSLAATCKRALSSGFPRLASIGGRDRGGAAHVVTG